MWWSVSQLCHSKLLPAPLLAGNPHALAKKAERPKTNAKEQWMAQVLKKTERDRVRRRRLLDRFQRKGNIPLLTVAAALGPI
jgi:hypothetical protein